MSSGLPLPKGFGALVLNPKTTVLRGPRYTIPFHKVSSQRFEKEQEPKSILCAECGRELVEHAEGKCLFESTSFRFTSYSEELTRWAEWYKRNQLGPYDSAISKIIEENSVKDIQEAEDASFLRFVDEALKASSAAKVR